MSPRHIEQSFYNANTLTARTKAIDYFKTTPTAFQITLYAFSTEPELEEIISYKSFGSLIIYLDVLLSREILANLNTEYRLYKLNGFLTAGHEQEIQLHKQTKTFKVLKTVSDENGKMMLR